MAAMYYAELNQAIRDIAHEACDCGRCRKAAGRTIAQQQDVIVAARLADHDLSITAREAVLAGAFSALTERQLAYLAVQCAVRVGIN